MAAKKKGGMYEKNPYNETSGGAGPEQFDDSGGGLYGDWEGDVLAVHLSMADGDMESTPNIKSGAGIMGGPAPGEPQVADYSGTAQSKGSK